VLEGLIEEWMLEHDKFARFFSENSAVNAINGRDGAMCRPSEEKYEQSRYITAKCFTGYEAQRLNL